MGREGDELERKQLHVWSLHRMRHLRSLIAVSLCFGLGSVLGSVFSVLLEPEGAAALRRWLDVYLSVSQTKTGGISPLGLLWPTLRLPLLLTLFQFTVLGVLLIPLAMGVRGFLLSFAVTGFVRSYTWKGLGAALVLFGIPSVLELTALFVLSVHCWVRAEALGRENSADWAGGSWLVSACCYGILIGSALLQSLFSGQIAHLLDLILR